VILIILKHNNKKEGKEIIVCFVRNPNEPASKHSTNGSEFRDGKRESLNAKE